MEGLSSNPSAPASSGAAVAARELVRLRGITKRFEATLALDRVDLDVQAGSVHGLVGENGAGKSTLGKILAGVHAPDDGTFLLDGEPVTFRSPLQALEHGVTIIAQELSLIPTRDVVDNVYLGAEDRRGLMLDRRRMRERFAQLVESTGLAVPPEATVGALSAPQQQQVEILRAVARNARLIVMDEPTSRLSAAEAQALYATIRSLVERGTTVVYVSHYLEEVLALSDHVTVLRDGRVVKTAPAASETPESLIMSMVGRPLARNFPVRRAPEPDATEVLRVEGLTREGDFEDVSMVIKAGEIVGLAGLVGAGRSEVARAIFGVDRSDSGRIVVAGSEIKRGDAVQMMASGVAMIPESRKVQGLLLGRSVRENVTLRHLGRFTRLGVVRRRREVAETTVLADGLDVRCASIEQPVSALSGGNQQKVLFGRWLVDQPRLLIADEPTNGVDVGAKRAIYELLAGLAENGVAVLLISSEIEEILGLAHRVLVMRKGRIAAELSADEATEHAVMEAAFGTVDSAHRAA